MRRCISCKATFNRENLLKITRDNNLGILINQGSGRSAYICKTATCFRDSKIKKKLQRALRSSIDQKIFKIIDLEMQNYK